MREMDHDTSFFSFDQVEELLGLSPSPIQEHHDVVDDQQNDQLVIPPLQNIGSGEAVDTQKPHFSAANDNVDHHHSRVHQKKLTHRNIEKQRRQEMSRLHRSLRSLLPIERLKGKRSMADHIHETVGYIRQLQASIEKLTETRDQLKLLVHPISSSATTYLSSCGQTSVAVRVSLEGLEVVVNTAYGGGVKLPRVLNILIQEGLSINCCIFTRVNGRLLHKIETKVNEGRSIDSTELQQKLTAHFCNGNWETNDDA